MKMEPSHSVNIFLSEAGKSFSVFKTSHPRNIIDDIKVVLEEGESYRIFSDKSIISICHFIPGAPQLNSITFADIKNFLLDHDKFLQKSENYRNNIISIFDFYKDAECVYLFTSYHEFSSNSQLERCGASFDIFKRNNISMCVAICDSECIRKITSEKLKDDLDIKHSVRFSRQEVAKYVKDVSEITGEGKYF